MAYMAEKFQSLQWENLIPSDETSYEQDNWNERWQSSFLHSADTFTAYQTRAHQIKSIRSEFTTFIQNIVAELTDDTEFWSSSNSSRSYKYIRLQRLDTAIAYNQWRSRLRSFELIHLILSYEHRELYLHTPLVVIVHHLKGTRCYPILATANVCDLSSEYVPFTSNISSPIECQKQTSTGRWYFMGEESHNPLMITCKDDVYLRAETILHFVIRKSLIQRSKLEALMYKRLKYAAKSLDRLPTHSTAGDSLARSRRITQCLHQNGVNCRYLGAVQGLVRFLSTRLDLLHEMISRSAKFLLRTRSQLIRHMDMSDICTILQDRYKFIPRETDIQIISDFIDTIDFWQRLALDCYCQSEIYQSALSHRKSLFFTDADKINLLSMPVSNATIIQYDPVYLNADLISIDRGIERWRRHLPPSSFDISDTINADLLAKRTNILLLIRYFSADYTAIQIEHIIVEISKITTSSAAKCLALSNAAIVLSYLQRFRQAFAIVNNIQSYTCCYLKATAQIQYNRGLLQDYVNTLHTLLRCESTTLSTDSQQDILFQLINASIELQRFDFAASLLERVESHVRRTLKPFFLVRFLFSLSKCHQALGQYTIASDILRSCLEIADKHLMGSDRIHLIYVLVELADLRLEHFKEVKFSAQLLHQSLTEYQLVHSSSSNDRYILKILRRLGLVHMKSGNMQLAARMLRMSVVRGQGILTSNISNTFEISALVEIALSYAQYEMCIGISDNDSKVVPLRTPHLKKSSEIWSQAWNRLSSSSALFRIGDCLEIALQYSKGVQNPSELDETLHLALNYANQMYSEEHQVPIGIKILIAKHRINLHRYDEAESILNTLHTHLNTTAQTRNSQVHVECWVIQGQLLYKQRRFFDLKAFIANCLLQIESERVCMPICQPEILFKLFVLQIKVIQRLCEFAELHWIIDRARTLCSKLYQDDIAGHLLLRNMSLGLIDIQRHDLAKRVIIEEWERCKLMAFHEQYLRSDSLEIRSEIWFLQFVRTTLSYANILASENVTGLAFKALSDISDILLQTNSLGHRFVQDLLFQVRFTEAHLLFRALNSQEEERILLEMLKCFQDEKSFRKAVIYSRLSSIYHLSGNKLKEKQFLKLAVTTLYCLQHVKKEYLMNILKRASRSKKEMTRLCNMDVYDLDSNCQRDDTEYEQPAEPVNPEHLRANRLHILKQILQFEQVLNIPHDYIARALIELAQVYTEERMFSEATNSIGRARDIIKSRRISIKIPDLEFVEAMKCHEMHTSKSKAKLRKGETMRSRKFKTNSDKTKASPYLS